MRRVREGDDLSSLVMTGAGLILFDFCGYARMRLPQSTSAMKQGIAHGPIISARSRTFRGFPNTNPPLETVDYIAAGFIVKLTPPCHS